MMSVRKRAFWGLILNLSFFVFPFLTFAEASIPAGLSPGPIWLSRSSLTEREAARVMTTVYNSTAKKIAGDAVFLADDGVIGTEHFELAPGEAKILSVEWSAKAGNHSFKARIENGTDPDLNQAVSMSGMATEAITVAVASAPPPPVAVQALNSAQKAIAQVASTSAPIVASVLGAVFDQTEDLRKSALASLETALGTEPAEEVKPETKKSAGTVLGAETYKAPNNTLIAAATQAASSPSVLRILQQVLLFIVSYVWVFYPLLIVTILVLLYLLGKTVTGRKYATRKA